MAVSKWEINRIGLIDFWYYDEEEFHFIDGRLLLRGANGSGKSVTMQSFIPLLLDGNRAPDRLDPFGTKARKIENYLLEENDGREERTGYLYMEFRRTESDTFITIGIGFRARRNKKLDSWYFAITDGRRIGKDFLLYREAGSKTTLSRQELKNRIGEGGELMESYRDYMKLVNDRLFGYETAEEYKELIDLLIQLRTPKLSKEFKPTVLNEILSSSLPPLSEDDLRPMSEAIENMDSLKSRLEVLLNAKKAADKIDSAYRKYNQAVLSERARRYKAAADALKETEGSLTDKEKERLLLAEEMQSASDALLRLQEEEKTLKAKKENLDKGDLAKIREKEIELENTLAQQRGEINKKAVMLEKFRSGEASAVHDLKQREEALTAAEKEIADKLTEMEAAIGEIPFDEHYFMRDEFEKEKERPYSFLPIKSSAGEFTAKIEQGVALLEQEERERREYDRLQCEQEELARKKDGLARELEQAETQALEVKAELTENLYKWNRGNRVLVLADEQLQRIARAIEGFDLETDYGDIVEDMRRTQNAVAGRLQESIADCRQRAAEAAAALAEKAAEIQRWQDRAEPEPDREERVIRNREKLTKAGIPFFPFYQAVEFSGAGGRKADLIEEALMEMGLLDALIVPSNYRNRVLAADAGLCDKYLFTETGAVEEGLGRLLEISEEINDLVLHQEIVSLLGNIGQRIAPGGASAKRAEQGREARPSPATCINEDGSYGLGVVHGTVTGTYQAKFIGRETRARYRLEVLRRLEEEKAALEEASLTAKHDLEEAERSLATLAEEAAAFPEGKDVREAVKIAAQLAEKISVFAEQIREIGAKALVLRDKIRELRIEISKIAQKAGIEGSLGVFRDAAKAMQGYAVCLAALEGIHKAYLRCSDLREAAVARLETVRESIDDVLYDKNHYESQARLCEGEIAACRQQLMLANYDQIAQELEACIKRLGELPALIGEKNRLTGELSARIANTAAEVERLSGILEERRAAATGSEAGFLEERALGYLPDCEPREGEAVYAHAKRLLAMQLAEEGKTVLDYLGKLQEQYYANMGELAEYGLYMKDIFAESEYKRQAIFCRYQGREAEFKLLAQNLTADIELQENLVRDSDRELFEDILANTISKKIRSKIYKSEDWVERMNRLMNGMNTSSGLTLSLVWKKKRAEQEEQLDTGELVELLKKDAEAMHESEFSKLSAHFHSKVNDARRILSETGNDKSFHAIMREILDYRKWFEFQLYYRKTGEQRRELTNNAFFTLSGGEKAMAMYVPLFSAVAAKYQSARDDAPRLISLDEAFAGVDEMNIRDMFKLMVEMDFEFIINSQILWGDCDTVPSLAIYQLLRPENAKYVTVIPYVWNGVRRQEVERIGG